MINLTKRAISLEQRDFEIIAKHCDNDYIGRAISVERRFEPGNGGFYSIELDKAPLITGIRVYCDLMNDRIDKIMVFGEQDESWRIIYPDTELRICNELLRVKS